MDNKYLEKVANAYKDYLLSSGKDVSGISSASLLASAPQSTNKGSFADVRKAESKISNRLRSQAAMQAMKDRTGLGPSKAGALPARVPGVTPSAPISDALKSYLGAHNEAVKGSFAMRSAPVNKYVGAIGKSTSFLKRHPLLSAGAALGVGVGIGKMIPKSTPQIEQYQGPYYG